MAAKNVDVSKLGLSGLFTGGLPHGADQSDQQNSPPHVLPTSASPILNYSPVAGSTPAQQAPVAQSNEQSFASAFPTGEQVQDLEARGKGKIAKVEAENRLPSEQALAKTHYDFNKQLQDDAHESAMEIKKVDRMIQQDTNSTHSRDTQLLMKSRTIIKLRLVVAGMGGEENSQNLVNSLKRGFATGEIKLNPNNRLHQVAYGQLQDDGWKAVDPVDIKEAKGMQNIEPLLGKLRKLANDLPDSPIGEALTRGSEAVKNTFITSKLRNEINIINSQIMNVARNTEGVTGRVLASALKPELDSLASVTSKSNMQDRIDNLQDNYVNKFQIICYLRWDAPSEQREVVDKKHGLLKPVVSRGAANKPDFLQLAPKTTKAGRVLNEEESIKAGHPVYQDK